ncbi:MAG: hypothetical protein K9K88_00595 [Desulfobacterales bacterium]|nr:hypothetical protein [Desulfobacterales bacterium]
MNPVAFAMTGLAFGLWLNSLSLLGISAEPAEEDGPNPAKSVAAGGSLAAAITLILSAFWLIVGNPFGHEGVQSLFSGIMGMYALLWIGVFAMQWFGLDGRPIGNLCLLMAIMQIIHIIGYAKIIGMGTLHDWITQLVLLSYTILLFMFWKLLNGKMGAALVGKWGMVTVVGTLYLLFFNGGILPVLW